MRTIETDYLVVGCGAAGLAFADALLDASGADIVMVDRRHAPGGHWNDAYPFVRLHQPSSYYGVNSLPLGADAIQSSGPNQGCYEQAGAAELCAYFGRAMQDRLLASGRVRWYPMCDYVGGGRFVSRLSGETREVKVRRRIVDATYLEPAVPATSAPPFEVEEGARCIPVGALAAGIDAAEGFTIVGAGKTAMDACLWLLQQGVPPEDLRWVRPRDGWITNREGVQSCERVGELLEAQAQQMEAAAGASSLEDLYRRLEERAQWLRLDGSASPTMYKAPIASAAELHELRRIEDVVRLGRLRRVGRETLHLDRGTVHARPGHVHVHCAAIGLNRRETVPMFTDAAITLQPIRTGLIPFNAAMVGYVEATRGDTAHKNRLCPPNRLPDAPIDWLRGTLIGANADYQWSKERDIVEWLERSRLNPTRGVRARASEPKVRDAKRKYVTHVGGAVARLPELLAENA